MPKRFELGISPGARHLAIQPPLTPRQEALLQNSGILDDIQRAGAGFVAVKGAGGIKPYSLLDRITEGIIYDDANGKNEELARSIASILYPSGRNYTLNETPRFIKRDTFFSK